MAQRLSLWEKIRRWMGIAPKFLCDNCRYDYPAACFNSMRPNVTKCDKYTKK